MFAASTLITLLVSAVGAAEAQFATVKPIPLTMRRVAAVNLAQVAHDGIAPPRTASAFEAILRATVVNRRIPRAVSLKAIGVSPSPRPASMGVSETVGVPIAPSSATQISGFPALNALDSWIGNGDMPIEPPDQGLCVGNGTVIEMTNLEYREYNTSGSPLGAPIYLNTLFGVPSADFLSDPKCYYDSPTNTFFMTATDLTDMIDKSFLLVGVMPAASSVVTTYEIDTTNDGTNGTPTDTGCPCFGDQPLLGADANAIVVSLNEFSQPQNPANAFNGSEVYLISKSDLAANLTARAFMFVAPIPLAGSFASSMQPAISPGGIFDTANGGTEFLMNSLDFFGVGDNRIAVWAVIDTCQLASSPCAELPKISLNPPIVHVRPYRDPPSANQPATTTEIPYGNSTGNFAVEQLDTGDDRLGQLVYANGKLYAALGTTVKVGGVLHAGLEYFIAKPSFRTIRSMLHFAAVGTSTYVAHKGLDLSYPSIGVTSAGKAVMAFSIMGSSMNPSAGWIPIAKAGLKQIHTAAAGAGPSDSLSGYANQSGSSVARWGDYSAAVADGNNIWMAAEYVPSTCDDATYAGDATCGGTRAPEANWGTFVSELSLP